MHASRRRRAMTLAATLALVGVAACSDDDAGPATTGVDAIPSTTGVDNSPPATEAETTTTTPPTSTATTSGASTSTTAAATTTTTTAAATYDFSAVGPIVQGFVDQHGLNGAGLIVVDRDDGVIHEQYWGDFGADRISLVASSSKMITAGVLLRLQDD